MSWIVEVDVWGNVKEWVCGEGECPACGGPCLVDFGQNGVPDRLMCPWCGHCEGWDG